jgi:MFS family permease
MNPSGREVYVRLLRKRSSRRLLVAALVGRMPLATISLWMLLGIDARYSYGVAGAACGACALGMGLGAPPRARLVDRVGGRPVLWTCFAGTMAALTLLVVAVDAHAGPLALVVLALLTGLFFPPLNATIRVAWTAVDVNERLLQAHLSVDTAILDASGIVGPPLAALLMTAFGMAIVGAILLATTAAAVVLLPSHGRPDRSAAVPAHWLGPVTSSHIRALVFTSSLTATIIAATEIALVHFALKHDETWASGLLYGLLAFGSIVGSVLYGAFAQLADARSRAARALSALGVGTGCLALATLWPPAVFVAAPLAGLAMGPTYTILTGMAASAAPSDARTETQAWINGGYGAGAALGTTLAAGISHTTLTIAGAALLTLLLAALTWRSAARPELPATPQRATAP